MFCPTDPPRGPARRGVPLLAQAETSLSPIIKQFSGIREPTATLGARLSGARLAINIAHEGRREILRASGGHSVDGVGVRRNEWAGWANTRRLSGIGRLAR